MYLQWDIVFLTFSTNVISHFADDFCENNFVSNKLYFLENLKREIYFTAFNSTKNWQTKKKSSNISFKYQLRNTKRFGPQTDTGILCLSTLWIILPVSTSLRRRINTSCYIITKTGFLPWFAKIFIPLGIENFNNI